MKKMEHKNGIKAALFDMDGVILDSMRFHVMAWKEAIAEFGYSVSEGLLYLYEGAIEPETAVELFKQNGCPIDCDMFHEIFSRQKALFREKYRSHVRPYPDVLSILEALRAKGLRLALVTSSHQEILEMILSEDIKALMNHVVTGDRVARRKPFPDPYLSAKDALCLESHECVVVENAPAGIQAAKAAKMHCVALTTTLESRHLSHADAVLSSHAELTRYLFQSNIF